MTNIAQTIELRREYEDRVIKAYGRRRVMEHALALAETAVLQAQSDVEHSEKVLRELVVEEARWAVAVPVLQSAQPSDELDAAAVK